MTSMCWDKLAFTFLRVRELYADFELLRFKVRNIKHRRSVLQVGGQLPAQLRRPFPRHIQVPRQAPRGAPGLNWEAEDPSKKSCNVLYCT